MVYRINWYKNASKDPKEQSLNIYIQNYWNLDNGLVPELAVNEVYTKIEIVYKVHEDKMATIKMTR